jgi:hypothetical protein
MSGAKERLSQLVALAAERQWTPLARLLCDLTLAWPSDYPEAMRPLVTALFETALRRCEASTRRELAPLVAGRRDVPLQIMNVLYLDAPAPLRREILMRNELEGGDIREEADAEAVVNLARKGALDFAAALSDAACIPYEVAHAVLGDASGEPLAVLCRGLSLNRATYSAIALLRAGEPLPLDVFDTVPDRAAAWLVHDWRKGWEQHIPQRIRAAE